MTATTSAPSRVSHVSNTLARHRIGAFTIGCFIVAAAAPLTVIAGGATTGYAVINFRGIPAAYVAAGLMLAVFAVGFIAMAQRIRNAGAFYSYIAAGLGRPLGVGAAGMAVLAYAAMQVGILGGFGAVQAEVLRVAAGMVVPWWACALAGWALIAVLGIARVKRSGRVLAALLIGEVLIVAIYDGVLLSHPAAGLDLSPLNPAHLLTFGGAAAVAGATAGFVGLEASVVFAEEAKGPHTIARATFLALTLTGVLYAVSAWALPVATGTGTIRERAAADGPELIFNLVAPHVGQTLVDVGHLLFLGSLFAGALAFHHTCSRYLFALGREHVAPPILGRASRRTGAPVMGSLAQSTVALATIVGVALAGLDPIRYLLFWTTVAGGIGVLVLMFLTSVAVVWFFRNDREAGIWSTCVFPTVAAVLLGLVLGGTVYQLPTLLQAPAGSPVRWLIPGAYLTAAAIGVGRAVTPRFFRPAVYAHIGLGVESALVPASAPVTAHTATSAT